MKKCKHYSTITNLFDSSEVQVSYCKECNLLYVCDYVVGLKIFDLSKGE